MTLLTTNAPITLRNPALLRIRLPKLAIAATINILSTSISKAVCLAYVDPFTARRPQTVKFVDADLEGRDPNW
jgi:hypothetical protein